LYDGQKTGLFLDHRDNRALLGRLAKDMTVLNLFAYTGAFSLYAARGGASRVTSVDIAPAAMRDAARNFSLNGFDPELHEFVAADCFKLLEDYVREGKQFDLVILDPPSLARSKDNRFAAARAYKKLNILALKCVREGGLLASASCTSQIGPDHFKEILLEAGLDTGRRLQILQENGHAPDHPVPMSFPEGRYLKFVLARA
jgi:23S rRNA (cytosine1962-C5)-methyltransferase